MAAILWLGLEKVKLSYKSYRRKMLRPQYFAIAAPKFYGWTPCDL